MKTQEQIKKDVVDQLYWDSRVDADQIKVEVKDDGKVVLTGTVPTYSEKNSAANVAWAVTGVAEVENQVNVEFPASFTVPSDEEIKSSVEQRLGWSTDVDSADVRVGVVGGLVTLSGSVSSFWQEISAETEAEKVNGVLGVTNKLAVVPTEDITDEVIGERIMDRIDQNTTVDVDRVDVKVKDGKVTLSGSVDTWDGWRAVYDAAQYTSGVRELDDQLIINYL